MTSTSLPNAPLIKRILAFSYDIFILTALSMAYSAIATIVMANVFASHTEGEYLPMQDGYWFLAGWVLCITFFYWFFWRKAGQTVGMRAWRLKIIDAEGNLPSHKQCLIRILVGPIALASFGLGYLWCLFNKNRAAWQDLASQTRVVQLPKKVNKNHNK